MLEININFAAAIIVFSFLVMPLLILVIFYKKPKVLKACSIILFVVYLIAIFLLVFGTPRITKSVVRFWIYPNADWFSMRFCLASFNKRAMFLNLIMMLPISAFILAITKKDRFYFKKAFLLTILVSFLLSVFIETMQFVLPFERTTELFDLLTNTISGVLGFCFFGIFCFVFERVQRWRQRREHL